jgi:hypothetical protein
VARASLRELVWFMASEAPAGAARPACVTADVTGAGGGGSSRHHHCVGTGFTRGHISSSVLPSYKRPFFITYRIVFVFLMSSSGFLSST